MPVEPEQTKERESVFPALRRVLRDGEAVWQVCCPTCGKWGDVDDDQLHGRVSMLHDECGWHETYDFSNDCFVKQEDEYTAIRGDARGV